MAHDIVRNESRKRNRKHDDSSDSEFSAGLESTNTESEQSLSDSEMFNPSQILRNKGGGYNTQEKNFWPKTLNISGNYLTFYRIDKALKRETLAMIIKVLSEMVETDHSSFFDQGPQTTNTSLGATTTEGSTIRGGGECQRPHSQGRQRISRCEVSPIGDSSNSLGIHLVNESPCKLPSMHGNEVSDIPERYSCHEPDKTGSLVDGKKIKEIPESFVFGFPFGGTYTSNVDNPLTQARECLLYFYPMAMSTDIKLCVSDDFELGFRYDVSFAGLFTCKSGNPLAIMKEDVSKNSSNNMHSYLTSANSELWPHACPTGYSNHLAALAESCKISYCVKSQSFSKQEFPTIRRPPFIELPRDAFLQLDENNGTFQALTGSNQSSQISSNQTFSGKSVNNMTTILIVSVLFAITALAMFTFIGFCVRRRLKKGGGGGKGGHEESRSQGGETECRSV
ncbi:uncharacterized protein LOC130047349 [Ostrea edulis]|uniref:uncharacterized protein LOC130047349 n=1 Tax=Ostrea edulis TaxID=37623 RepID=UPI0024AF3931|nr:uncharacterized protein LOC130047349 [Ostrea edulis]